jgi:predicted RNase H-like HicB family nuclease
MKTRKKFKTPSTIYPVVIEYSAEDEGYVARVPALKYCSAWGETYEQAAHEIQIAMGLWLASAKAHGTPIPPPIKNAQLSTAAELLNLTALARESGIPAQTLFAKLRRGTTLKSGEALAIARALNEAGLHLVAKAG